MAGSPFRITTYRAGVEVATVTRPTRHEAERVFADAVASARRVVERQKVPRRVELQQGGMLLDAADVAVASARAAGP